MRLKNFAKLMFLFILSLEITSCSNKGMEPDLEPKEIDIKEIDIIDSFAAPNGTQPSGLAFWDNSLFMSSYILGPGIFRLNPNTGEEVGYYHPDIVWDNRYGGLAPLPAGLIHAQANNSRSIHILNSTISLVEQFGLPGDFRNISDLAFSGNSLWYISNADALDLKNYRLNQFNINTRTLEFSAPIPKEIAIAQNHGLTFYNGVLWISSSNTIIKYDTVNHKVIEQFVGPFQRLENLAWDGTYLWGASFGGMIYKMSPN
ncbi:MAG: hypothetical protein E2O79_03805 [Caldithrix sp.]|nr:MAG: hypothetical protein E2O79_03805 [Caldithrix sp.]